MIYIEAGRSFELSRAIAMGCQFRTMIHCTCHGVLTAVANPHRVTPAFATWRMGARDELYPSKS